MTTSGDKMWAIYNRDRGTYIHENLFEIKLFSHRLHAEAFISRNRLNRNVYKPVEVKAYLKRL